MKFRHAPAPHLAPPNTVAHVMLQVLFALVPATLAWVWFFGPGLLINMFIAVSVALACEALMLRLRGRRVRVFLGDYTAILTAVLLCFAIPPLTPWWVTTVGVAFAIIVAKHLFGGLGYNPFNPAMAGYVVLLVSFPARMTLWLPPGLDGLAPVNLDFLQTLSTIATGDLPAGLSWDAVTMATPLDQIRTGMSQMQTVSEVRQNPLFGDFGGRGWEWIANWFAVGGLWLLYKGIIRWHIPVSMLVQPGCHGHGVLPDRSWQPPVSFVSSVQRRGDDRRIFHCHRSGHRRYQRKRPAHIWRWYRGSYLSSFAPGAATPTASLLPSY